jgi:hypothetical protein
MNHAVKRQIVATSPLTEKIRFEDVPLPELELNDDERLAFLGAFDDGGRFTAACTLASAGVSLQVIQKILGHTSSKMTERYVRVNDTAIAEARHAFGREGRIPWAGQRRRIRWEGQVELPLAVSLRRRCSIFFLWQHRRPFR